MALVKKLVDAGLPFLVMPVNYAEMDFVVSVERKADRDAKAKADLARCATEATMRTALTHLSIIGERCDVKAAALKGLAQ
jgi:hypothetical protein